MSLTINTNLMAANTARTLNSHYGRLAASTQRLSSGLRINGAADDAAGLAIRELMRADVAALHQGVRNANDAISMIQVVDGALGIIDEKLIRMKELAEQAATGTYDSTQRLMIDSEFQAMASEIERIANATDFNSIKLLNKQDQNTQSLDEIVDKLGIKLNDPKVININRNDHRAPASVSGDTVTRWSIDETEIGTTTEEYIINNDSIYKRTINDIVKTTTTETTIEKAYVAQWSFIGAPLCSEDMVTVSLESNTIHGFGALHDANITDPQFYIDNIVDSKHGDSGISHRYYYHFFVDLDNDTNADFYYSVSLPSEFDADLVKNSIRLDNIYTERIGPTTDIVTTRNNTVSMEKIADLDDKDGIPPNIVKIHFGPMNDSAEDYYYIEKRDCTLKGLGLEDVRVETQDNAQKALVTINDAIVKKDQARAYYGAMQNRLENTISNLTIQAENLQASESRISDVDVATEMTNFVRNQILTQSAVSMLAQANSLPQMAMQLIGG